MAVLSRCFGSSVIGPAHERRGLPNQDAWLYRSTDWYDCVVVADGLGSRRKSERAASSICEAMVSAADHLSEASLASFDPSAFLGDVLERFAIALLGLSRRDCGTTCLGCLRTYGKIHLFLCGDGLVAAVCRNGQIIRLEDDKSASFSNLVSALDPEVEETCWLYRAVSESDCLAVVLCTDGISDDLEDAEGFLSSFVEEYSRLSVEEANQAIGEMLRRWPVAFHADDKTIVCLFFDEVETDGQ